MTNKGVQVHRSSKYQEYLASREWSIRRNDVHRRADNKCERCFRRPIAAVHHLTYENIYKEPVEDLRALCNECHDWLHGKMDHDELYISRFYFAGKIKPLNDWRRKYLDSDITYSHWEEKKMVFFHHPSYALQYAGPYYMNGCTCGHCSGQHLEGWTAGGCCGGVDYRDVLQQCRNWLMQATAVYAFIDDQTAFGTIAELGWAYEMKKPILLCYSSQLLADSMKFVTAMATRLAIDPCPYSGLETLLNKRCIEVSKFCYGTEPEGEYVSDEDEQ